MSTILLRVVTIYSWVMSFYKVLVKSLSFQEPFVQACVNFLKRRFPMVTGGAVKEEPQTKNRLPAETVTTMLSCLQVYAK